MRTIEKILLVCSVVSAIALALMLLKPLSHGEEYWLKYCREKEKELAEAIEAKVAIRLSSIRKAN